MQKLAIPIWFSWLCNGANKGVFCIISNVLSANGSRHPDMHLYQGVDPRNCLKKAARDIFACICYVITPNEKWKITHFSSDASCLTGLCWLLSVPGNHHFPSLKALPLKSYITSVLARLTRFITSWDSGGMKRGLWLYSRWHSNLDNDNTAKKRGSCSHHISDVGPLISILVKLSETSM